MFSINDITLVELNLMKCDFLFLDDKFTAEEGAVTLKFNVSANFNAESDLILFDVFFEVDVVKVNGGSINVSGENNKILSINSQYNAIFQYHNKEAVEDDLKQVIINNAVNLLYPSLRADIVYLLGRTSISGVNIPLSFPYNKN